MTTRVPPNLLDLSKIPVFRAGLVSNTTIPTGLAAPQWFSGFSAEFDPTGSFIPARGRSQPTVPGYYHINARVSFTSDGLNASFVAAAGKELWDAQGHGTPDRIGALVTVAGGVLMASWLTLVS